MTSEIRESIPDWENPAIFGINKDAPRAHFTPCGSPDADPATSTRCRSLNGDWSFYWSRNPDERPVGFEEDNYPIEDWPTIRVPGNWQTQGYGVPIYANSTYPFQRDKPRVTSTPPEHYTSHELRNPVGSYKRTFTIPADWQDMRVYLHFAGVKSAMYVWVNGKKVGYSQNSMSPAEFDISPYLQEGRNTLACEVYRWSDGSYLEDQDMWRFSGIFRDVTLVARSALHIRDFNVTTDLDANYQGAVFTLCAHVRNQGSSASGRLRAVLKDPDGCAVPGTETLVENIDSLAKDGDATLTLSMPVQAPILWSHETPALYSLTLMLEDENGELLESTHIRVGFRSIEIRDKQLWLNGVSIKLKGVNRHEHHPRTGRTMDTATMILDLELMKQGNVNLVRTSHYPCDSRWYDLCDEYGMLVMDEANQEGHGYGQFNGRLADDPEFTLAYEDRARSLVERDKNHPCVIIWSLGNEGGCGQNLLAMRKVLDGTDTTRPVLCDTDPRATDLADHSYVSPAKLAEASEEEDKPVIMREYAHAMGNSLGNFAEFWEQIYKHANLVGGAIWEWCDHGLAKRHDSLRMKMHQDPSRLSLDDGEFWAYGGDFKDHPNEGNFCIDGLVGPDRVPNPHYYEMKKVYESVQMTAVDITTGTIEVFNAHTFTNLNSYEARWELCEDGTAIAAAVLEPVECSPLESTAVTIPVPTERLKEGCEYTLTLSFLLKSDMLWAKKGWAIAAEQFIVREATPGQFGRIGSGDGVAVTDNKDVIEMKGETFVCTFSKCDGSLLSYSIEGAEVLARPLTPYFWKVPTDNQLRNRYSLRLGPWKYAHNQLKVDGVETTGNTIAFTISLPVSGAPYRLTYQADCQGALRVSASYEPDRSSGMESELPLLPQFGMHMAVPADLNHLSWYGRGPHENYCDRQVSSFLGCYEMSLKEYITPYIYPQDNANRMDIRWMELSGNGSLRIVGETPVQVRAWPYDEEDLDRATHDHELPQRDCITVNIASAVHGVGGNDSWGARTMPQYTNPAAKPYQLAFCLIAAKAQCLAQTRGVTVPENG